MPKYLLIVLLALGMFALGLLVSTSTMAAQQNTPLPDSTVLDTATVWTGNVWLLGNEIHPPFRFTNVPGDSVRLNGYAILPGIRYEDPTPVTITTSPCIQALNVLDAQVLQLEQRMLLREHRSRAEITDSAYAVYKVAASQLPMGCLEYIDGKNTAEGSFMLHIKLESSSVALQLLHQVYRAQRPRQYFDLHRLNRGRLQLYRCSLAAGDLIIIGDGGSMTITMPRPDASLIDRIRAAQTAGSAAVEREFESDDTFGGWVAKELAHPKPLQRLP